VNLSTLCIFLILYRRKTYIYTIPGYFTVHFIVGKEKVVFSDKTESCIVGIIASGITSLTSEVLL